MRWPLVVLAVPTVVLGFLGLSAAWLPTWMQANATMVTVPTALVPEPVTVALSAVAVFAGGGLAWLASKDATNRDLAPRLGRVRRVLADGFGMDALYELVGVRPFRVLVRLTLAVDEGVVAPAVRGSGRLVSKSGGALQELQRGNVQRYLSGALTAVVLAVVLALVAVAT
jgi:NADH-quinone oxidoreductase subunit L